MSRKLSLDEQRKIQLDGLLYIKKMCDSNNIKYYLGSGTLLGAVKYQGYIPWDDDIDIFLLRNDYEKLLNVLDFDENDDFKVLTCYNTKDYYYPYAKLVSTHTKLIDNAREIKELGVFVDIFPIDFFPDNVEEYYNKIRFVRNLATKRMSIKDNIVKSKNEEKIFKKVKFKFLKDLVYEFVSVITLPLGYNFWTKVLDKLAKRKNGDKAAQVYLDPLEVFDADLFSDFGEYNFEGNTFTSVANYDEYLSQTYGDYKKELPKSKQITHHQMEVYERD